MQTFEDYKTVAFDMATGQRLWVATYDGPGHFRDALTAVKISPDGAHVYVTGRSVNLSTSSDTTYEYATIAYDAATGTQQWVARFNSNAVNVGTPMTPASAEATALEIAPDGSRIYVTGQTSGALGAQYATVAYDAMTGAQLWVTTYQGLGGSWSFPRAITVSPDGARVFVTGVSASLTKPYDYVTAAYDSASGAQLWTAAYDGPYDDEANDGYDEAGSIACSPDGLRVYVTGFSTGANGFYDYATISYDASSGAEQWVARYAGPGNAYDVATIVRVSPDGASVFVTGENVTFIDDFHSTSEYPTVAYDAVTGAQKWLAKYPGPNNDSYFGVSLAVSPDNQRVYVVQMGANGAGDFVTTSYDAATGAQGWIAQYGGSTGGLDLPIAIAAPSDGSGPLVVGTTPGAATQDDFALVRYTAAGAQQWTAEYNGPGVSDEASVASAVSPDSTAVYVSGWSTNGTPLGLDYVTAAYDSATGEQKWLSRYHRADSSYEITTGMQVSHNGRRVFVTGYTSAPYNGAPAEYTTVAYDAATGAQLWAALFAPPRDSDINSGTPYAIAVSPDDKRVYVTGNVHGSKGGFTSYDEIGTVAYDAETGALLWTAYYDQGAGIAWTIGATPDGQHVIVAGQASGVGTSLDFVTVDYDAATGAQQWVATWNNTLSNAWDTVRALAVSPDSSSVFVTGESYDSLNGAYMYATIAYDVATGAEKWEKMYSGSAHAGDLPAAIAVSPDGARVYVTGLSSNNFSGGDYGTIAYDAATGDQLWVANYDHLGSDLGMDVAVTPDNSLVVVTGQSDGALTSRDFATVFYDAATGEQKLVARYDGPASGYDVGARVSVSTDSTKVFVTGPSPGTDNGPDIATLAYDTSVIGINPPPPVSLTGVVSRKIHDSGAFDLNLPTSGTTAIECRSGGANSDYTVIFTFASQLKNVGGANITSGTGSVSSSNIGNDPHQYVVSLSGVSNAQILKITLVNVNDAAGNHTNAVSASMGMLLGDVNGDRVVSNTDVALVKAQVAAPVDSSNFRNDVNASGTVNNTDVGITKAQVSAQLP